MDILQAKQELDNVISLSKDKFYKPTQIAEILFHFRNDKVNETQRVDKSEIDFDKIRKNSKKWRNNISSQLVGRNSNSSSRFEDNLFEKNAITEDGLAELISYNNEKNGVIEAYIYNEFKKKYKLLNEAFDSCKKSSNHKFYVKEFIESFVDEKTTKGISGKIYEIVVYALLSSLTECLKIKVNLTIPVREWGLLSQIPIFSEKIMRIPDHSINELHPLSNSETSEFFASSHIGKFYRVGVTNAADRGVDMYANWGCLVQVKNSKLSLKLAEAIINEVTSDNVVIVCRSATDSVVESIMQQGWSGRIQSIVTQKELEELYEQALRGDYSNLLGQKLLDRLVESILAEFPSAGGFPSIILDRNYPSLDIELEAFQGLE